MNEYSDLTTYEGIPARDDRHFFIILKIVLEILFVSFLIFIMADIAVWMEAHPPHFEFYGLHVSYEAFFMAKFGSIIVFSSWHIASYVRKLFDPSYDRSQDLGYKLIFWLASIVSLSSILIITVPFVIVFWPMSQQGVVVAWYEYIPAIAFIVGVLLALRTLVPAVWNHMQEAGGGSGFTFFLIHLIGWISLAGGLLFTAIIIFVIFIIMARFIFTVMRYIE
ncbi:hypothetical protein CYL18_14855 [Pradoshia eiseniae]|uniref:Uncharacterized protein n=1 Tax=Pradoshia eiseniae TaxID=2064768 RepID=A0A2S7MX28_9BACI|nr:hypothetical protein [Pradoshia eiseniae]PQD94316.1 hypothetical protein CYL18_14855 [Pradoshia eiseniae]